MKQIIEDVLQAEATAAEQLKAARQQAAAITARAEAASLERINQAKQQCRQEMQAMVEEATRSAEEVKARMLAEADGQMRDFLAKNADRVDGVVEAICRLVLGDTAGKDTA